MSQFCVATKIILVQTFKIVYEWMKIYLIVLVKYSLVTSKKRTSNWIWLSILKKCSTNISNQILSMFKNAFCINYISSLQKSFYNVITLIIRFGKVIIWRYWFYIPPIIIDVYKMDHVGKIRKAVFSYWKLPIQQIIVPSIPYELQLIRSFFI